MKSKIEDIEVTQNYSRPYGVGDVSELAESMAIHGQITPIITHGGKLVAGFRRLEAAKKLGWEEIDTVECQGDPAVVNLIENMQREGLSLWDEIQAIRSVFPRETSHAEIARALSKSRGWVAPRVDIWSLPQVFIDKVRDGRSGINEIRKVLKPRRPATETTTSRPELPTLAEIKELVSWLMNEGRVEEARALSYACGTLSRAEVESG